MTRCSALLLLLLLAQYSMVMVLAQTRPTRAPRIAPTQIPTGVPSSEPSHKPSRAPIARPTFTPTNLPIASTRKPRTNTPTGVPSFVPTVIPTEVPFIETSEPTSSARPSRSPRTRRPTFTITAPPTGFPSRLSSPTSLPSNEPSDEPSEEPSESIPSEIPTNTPTVVPSELPSVMPVSDPSFDPSIEPSSIPSDTPSLDTSISPSFDPSDAPSSVPSLDPSDAPSPVPSVDPSSASPSEIPSFLPTEIPSIAAPTSDPSSFIPSLLPTNFPSSNITALSTPTPLLSQSSIIAIAAAGSVCLLVILIILLRRCCNLSQKCKNIFCCCFTWFACCCRRKEYNKPEESTKEETSNGGLFGCFKKKIPLTYEQKEDLELGEIVLMDVSQLHGRAADKALKKMRKDIDKMHAYMTDRKESMQPLMLERAGINAMVVEQRIKLEGLFSKKDALLAERAPLMEECWEADADVIYEAFNDSFRVDKGALIDVLANRARWQINLISEVFERKYNKTLKDQISTQLTTLFGTIVTGSQTYLCKLLIYRILEQPERDASILEENISDQDVIIELFATRTNQELRHAIQIYDKNNVKMFSEIIQTKGYANYKTFMAQALELNRDETLDSFGNAEATALADELYKAGRGRTIGNDPEPFIRVFTRINPYQFESINEVYKKKRLKEDIKKCFGGDFAAVLLSRCGTKYAFLAERLDQAFKGLKADKNTICRILGCISRKEGVALREAYNNGQYGRKLDTALKTALKKGNFLKACLSVIEGEKNLVADASVFPLGSDREESEDQVEVGRDGDRAMQAASQNYNQKKVKELGARQPINDEFVIPNWDVSVKLYYNKAEDLAVLHEEFVKARDKIVAHKEAMADDVLAKKDTYYAMVKLCTETEAWIRILNGHITALKNFASNRASKFGK